MRLGGFFLITAAVIAVCPAFALDERRVVSPDGQVEFRLFVGSQPESSLSRVAYQLRYRGQLLIDTSYLGFDLYTWEPMLGENVGLISETHSDHAIKARFMQNGSLARLLDVEVRAFNDGVAFRCTIGKSTGVERLQIADETTEFDLPHAPGTPLTLPFVAEEKGVGWVAISEVPVPGLPRMGLAEEDFAGKKILLSRLTRKQVYPDVVYDGKPPLTLPWRVITIAPTRELVMQLAAERQASLASQP